MPSKAAPKRDMWAVRGTLPSTTGRVLSIVSIVVLFAAWCVLSYVTTGDGDEAKPLVSPFFLPPPHEVVRSLIQLIVNPELDLLGAIRVSTTRIIIAILLSIAVALPVGILMATFDLVNRLLEPIVAPLRYLPITAFIPLLILWFGIEESQKIAFLFLGTVVYLLPAVVDAIRAVPDEMVQTAFTLGASKGQVIRTVLIPAAMPQIFDGLRVMNAIAWTYIILAEMVNTPRGIGAIMQVAGQRNKTDWLFAGILVVGIIGIVTDTLINLLNKWLFRWREADV